MRRVYVAVFMAGVVTMLAGCGSSNPNDSGESTGEDNSTYYVEVSTPAAPVDCIVIRTYKGAGVTCNWDALNN